jgi:hypothetical protein
VPGLKVTQVFTPPSTHELDVDDLDLGSSAPALLGHNRVLIGGKDHRLRLLALNRLDGRRAHRGAWPSGGELQTISIGGPGEATFDQFAVIRQGSSTWAAVATGERTILFKLVGGRLHKAWEAKTPGTSPVYAGGLLYVYDLVAGGVYVYRPTSPHPLAVLPAGPGHWNSPIVVDGHLIVPEGDANQHLLHGTLEIFGVRH